MAFRKRLTLAFIAFSLFSASSLAHATDAAGKVIMVVVRPDALAIQMSGAEFSSLCATGWGGTNVLIPKSNPDFPYFYGQIMAAFKENWTVYLPNASATNTGVSVSQMKMCDVTKSGAGIAILK